MQANWFPEHLEAGAKIFEAEAASQNPTPAASTVESLTSYAAQCREYITKGSGAVTEWLEQMQHVRIRMTEEGSRLYWAFFHIMEKSVNRTMPTPARALDRAASGALILYMNLIQEFVPQYFLWSVLDQRSA